MVLEGFPAKVTSEQRLEGRERLSHLEHWAVCYNRQRHKGLTIPPAQREKLSGWEGKEISSRRTAEGEGPEGRVATRE